jgi:hypothetical protein
MTRVGPSRSGCDPAVPFGRGCVSPSGRAVTGEAVLAAQGFSSPGSTSGLARGGGHEDKAIKTPDPRMG